MMFSITFLSKHDESEYEKFIGSHPTGMFFWSIKYRNLIKEFLDAQDIYLIAKNETGNIVGALPAFLHSGNETGRILNSMPFYGSHGGAISDDPIVKQQLINRFYSIAADKKCLSATIISSPFESGISLYDVERGIKMKDERIGQLTELVDTGEDSCEAVMAMIPSKTRNMVRKAMKVGVSVSKDRHQGMFDFLHSTHEANMNDIGGISKPRRFFDLVDQIYEYGKDYEIYTAWFKGIPIAAMLVFYFHSFVEYFTPVIVKDYRSYQPLSLLIYQGMVDAVRQGRRYWNWGGTWKEQDGVYRFKKSWGAKDFPYYYYTNVLDRTVLNVTKDNLLRKYPYFYVLPFSALES